MKIAFDSQIFSMQKYGGISRYICSLATKLSEFDGVEAKIFAPFYINDYLKKVPEELVYGIKVPQIPRTGRIFHLSSLWLAKGAIARYSPQIVHETYYTASPVPQKEIRTVVTVYDMIHELFPAMFPQQDQTARLKRESVLRADHVICISENTRRDLLKLVPISPHKVSVVYLGFDQFHSPAIKAELESSLRVLPYLLYVGGRGHYKNFNGLLQAYGSSTWLMQNYRIVCAGGGKLRGEELELMQTLGIPSGRVVQMDANDDVLAEYYRGAAAFIYPSKYEGFGIPPLEAMSLRCPVICSNTSSIPEVVGDAGEYFDPNSADSIRVAIEQVLQNKERRDVLIQKGAERSKVFSWERCASETLAIYRSIV